ncbi:hypothetical protein ACWEQG_20690 [Microbispora sp. NPDC004025]
MATLQGIDNCRIQARSTLAGETWSRLAELGRSLSDELPRLVQSLDLASRTLPMLRSDEEEERLARVLLCAAWFALNYRNPFAFPDTPLFKAIHGDAESFDFERMLQIATPALVNDLLAQLHAAEDSPLDQLRAQCAEDTCLSGPVFEGSALISADADLIADGILIDFKSTRNVHIFSQATIQQLLGHVLLDLNDQYSIDSVGVYLTRAAALITWPVDRYLALLGTRRRELKVLRTAFFRLIAYEHCRPDDDPLPDQLPGVERLLAELVAPVPSGACLVCAQPMPPFSVRRLYCSAFCGKRAVSLRTRGWIG